MMEQDDPRQVMPLSGDISIHSIVEAYIQSLLEDTPMTNPIFESMASVDGNKWLRVTCSMSHEWVTELPPEARQALEEQQRVLEAQRKELRNQP